MKKIQLSLLFLIIITNSFGQEGFVQAYFINNEDVKINCFIKDVDSRSNPLGFEYILEINGEIFKASISTVKEFGIQSSKKFVRFSGKIDRSAISLGNVNYNKNPEWSDEILFLKTLVEGEVSLYAYYEGNLRKYFYRYGDQPIEQLVFKSYKIDETTIRANNYFQQQLFTNVHNIRMDPDDYEKLKYKESELVKYFLNYYKSKGFSSVQYETLKERESFNLKVAAGVCYSNFEADNDLLDKDLTFDPAFSFSIGIEAEYVLPFLKNRLALFINPTFNYYKVEETVIEIFLTIENTYVYKTDYTVIDLPIGIRYYIFLKEKSKLFFDLGFVSSLDINSEITRNSSEYLEILSVTNARIGAGYAFNNYSLELNFDYDKNLLGNYLSWNSSFNRLSLIFKYQL